MRAAEAVGIEAETETETATEAKAAATTKQKWEQECAKAVRYHQKQQEWERRWQRDGWWAALDERISRLETASAKQAQATIEMFKMIKAQ